MRSAVFCLIALGASVAVPVSAQPEEPVLPRDHGPLLTAGLGNNYGFLGFELAYSLRVPSTLYHVAPHVGLGSMEGAQVALGIRGGWGLRHRVVLDASYGPLSLRNMYLHGVGIGTQTYYGPMIAGGYEYVANWGFVFRATVGVGYAVDSPFHGKEAGALNLGIGFKLW